MSVATRALLHPTDPGHFALRGAIRTAIVAPVVFAIGLQMSDQVALFAVFGALATSVFVDFSGPRPVRALAYVALSVAGCAFIALGTLCSRSPIAAGIGMLVVGFVVLFAGVVNGYLASAASAALLSFVLPVMVAAEPSAIDDRVIGWLLAAVVVVPSILFLLPSRPRDRIRAGVATACGAVADLVAERTDATVAAARAAIDDLHKRFTATPFRPTGPTGATGALAEMVDELDWLTETAETLIHLVDPRNPFTAAEQALHRDTVAALRAAGDLISAQPPRRPDIDALTEGRERVVEELLDMLQREGATLDDDTLWARFSRSWQVRITSYVALDLAVKAQVASGDRESSGRWWWRYLRRQSIALAASRRLAAAHADVRSVWLRNSVRGAIGLAAAVVLAQELNVQHGFWVVLGVISVLRSNAMGTGRTIVQAFVGTLTGIVVAALAILAIDDHRVVLWVVLPPAVFFAAYAPKAISFAAGQAGFTAAVLIVFNLIEPTGWEVGLVRIEDVSIGFAISLGVGLLFWPRGARALVRRSLGEAFSTAGRYTGAVCARMYGGVGPTTEPQAQAAIAAEGRLDVALRQRFAERGPHDNEHLAAYVRLSAGAARLRRTGSALDHLCMQTLDVERPAAALPLLGDGYALSDWYAALGESIDLGAAPPRAYPVDGRARPAVAAGVRESLPTGDRERIFAALTAVWTSMHIELLTQLEPRMSEAARRLL